MFIIIGLFAGAIIGWWACSLCVMAKRSDEEIERLMDQE